MDAKTTSVAQFEVRHLQFINENHELVQPLPEFATPDKLLHLYRQMSLIRLLDNKAVNLQRTGKMGTYPAARGQEAIGVGMGDALAIDDVFCPYYRDQATQIMRGVKLSEIFSIWGGDERGNAYANPAIREDFPICIPIATQFLHAAGVAYAIKYRKQKRAVLTGSGEGGTSKGDFYEALNAAGAWKLPMVFVINNNQWAISVPLSQQTGCETIAQKAIAGGFEGIQVDGNDVIAVRYAVGEALKKAREGGGATLIEAITYRLCDHTTADDATRYQPAEELKAAWKCEPLARLGFYLESQGLWSREQDKALQETLSQEIETAVSEYMDKTPPKPTDMFDYMYEKIPASLAEQRAIVETASDTGASS